MAGMELAYTLKQRGHNPILFEAENVLGGQFILAGLAPRKADMKAAAIHRGKQVQEIGVDVRLGTSRTPEGIKELRPDVVVNAAGATSIRLKVPGIDGPNVYSYPDILNGNRVPTGDVMVIGGGLVGLETAGDAVKPRRALDATAEGGKLARAISPIPCSGDAG